MGTNRLLIGEVARRSGASRKALRLYEAAGILPEPSRTLSGYRVYDNGALELLSFVRQARRSDEAISLRTEMRGPRKSPSPASRC